MTKKPVFVLPASLEIDASGDALHLSYDGDVELEQTFGKPLGDVIVTGDLTVRLPLVTGTLRAGGRLTVEGRVECESLHAREVVLGKQDIKARAISADRHISIGAAKLQVDVIIAPEILLDPKSSGRVTVIESLNDPGPTKIKGGFSLREYEEVFGDTTAFLMERGVQRLDRADAPEEAAEPAADEAAEPAPERSEPREATPPPAARQVTGGMSSVNAMAAGAALVSHLDEDTSDPMSLSIEDLEPVAQPSRLTDELHPKLVDAVRRIAACYEGKETPPAVDELRRLVDARNYEQLRENITEVWNGLLGFHQKKGIRPHHQVTHAFNVIHGLVQN